MRALVVAAVVYASWLSMMALHEFGHVLAAWCSGGRVQSVSIPPLGFSRTIVQPNPHPLVVVWGGPIFGTVFPLIAAWLAQLARGRAPDLVKFFAGFCAIVNGAYIGFGWLDRAGDAGDLLRRGTPISILMGFGIVSLVAGFVCWHHTQALTRSRTGVNSRLCGHR